LIVWIKISFSRIARIVHSRGTNQSAILFSFVSLEFAQAALTRVFLIRGHFKQRYFYAGRPSMPFLIKPRYHHRATKRHRNRLNRFFTSIKNYLLFAMVPRKVPKSYHFYIILSDKF